MYDLKKLQKIEVVILDEIVRICNKYNLDYWLIGGTLLGAVRHQGFIPWDDDIDICMPREHYEKFCEIAQEELGHNFFFRSDKTDIKYHLKFAKVEKIGTKFIEHEKIHQGIYVDVFPLDRENNAQTIKKKEKKIYHCELLLGIKRGIYKSNLIAQILAKICPFSLLQKRMKKIMMSNKGGGAYYMSYGSPYGCDREMTLLSNVYPLTKLVFCGKEYNVPKEYNAILSNVYGGDYMQLPPEEKRITHKPLLVDFGNN